MFDTVHANGKMTVLYYIISLLLGIFLCIYVYVRYSYTYWKRKGVPHLKPHFPLGNNDCIGFESHSFGLEVQEWYKELKRRGLKFGGAWSWAAPVLVVTDPDYIKDILIKDFNSFGNRDFYHNPKYEPKTQNLFVAEKDEWRNLRQKMTPVFTSAKMKMMFEMVVRCSGPMLAFLEKYAQNGDDIAIKEVTASFTTDVIGCIAFGLEFGSFTSEDAMFRKIGREVFRSTLRSKVNLVLSRLCPNIARILRVTNNPAHVIDFFADIVTENVKYRRENNVIKPDVTQLLMELHDSFKGQENEFTFDDIIGNVILFFIAGFDTSSSTLHFALYELAKHPKMQEKARKEIEAVLKKQNNELTYEAIQEMPYVRQTIEETLRKYPPVQTVTRISTQPYNFKGTNFTLEKGVTVAISALGLHRDPDYYPDPERFDPERFSTENKATRHPCVYIPFGEGPRNCIGKRFGLMQTTVGLVQILRNYRLSVSSKMKEPMTLMPGVFLMRPKEDVYLKAKKI